MRFHIPVRIGPLRELVGSPWLWACVCATIRLASLLLLPSQKSVFADRETTGSSLSAPAGRLAFLQRRTDFHPLTVDEHCYDEMARHLQEGRGFVLDSVFVITTPGKPAMYAGCGYPLFVAGVYWLGGKGNQVPVYVLQILLQAISVVLLHQAADRVGGRLAAMAASAFFSFHPVLVWLALSMMTEAVLVPAMAALIWLVVLRHKASRDLGRWLRVTILAVLLAIMCLTRSTCFGFGLIVFGCVLWEGRHGRGWWQRMAEPLTMVVVFCLLCAPWTIRNYVHWGRFIPFSTKSGVNAWFFNHPGLVVEFGIRAIEGPQPIDIFDPRIQGLPDEAARDARLMQMFQEFVRADPVKFLGLCWVRFWMALLPVRITSTTLSAAVSAWYAKGIVLLLLSGCLCGALAGRLRWRRLLWRVAPLIGFVAVWQAVQTLAGPGMRYRLPAEPAWACLVGAGFVGLLAFSGSPRQLPPLARRWLKRQ